MADTFSPTDRSRIMARVKSSSTGPELLLRHGLFKRGFRYRCNQNALPGKPDLVFARYKAVIFVHGCFWHWHGCARSRMPETNKEYWEKKISRNQSRDAENIAQLVKLKWRVLVVWECRIKSSSLDKVLDVVSNWLIDGEDFIAATIDDEFALENMPFPQA